MRQAAMAWNMQQNREVAVKMQKKALDAVTKEVGVLGLYTNKDMSWKWWVVCEEEGGVATCGWV